MLAKDNPFGFDFVRNTIDFCSRLACAGLYGGIVDVLAGELEQVEQSAVGHLSLPNVHEKQGRLLDLAEDLCNRQRR
jgi:hypothetical protein